MRVLFTIALIKTISELNEAARLTKTLIPSQAHQINSNLRYQISGIRHFLETLAEITGEKSSTTGRGDDK